MKRGLIFILPLIVIVGLLGYKYYFISEESSAVLNEAEGEELNAESPFQKFVEPVFEEVNCTIPERKLDESYYQGKLIDTHIHVPAIPDDSRFNLDNYDGKRPVMGADVKIKDYICMMESENTDKVFAFFPVWDPIMQESLDIVKITMEKYPDKFVPFIMPPDHDDRADGYPTVDAEKLSEMLSVYPGLFEGYGEIGLYERGDHTGVKGAKALPPDSERLKEIYPVVRENNLLVYFHLGEGQKESFEKTLQDNRDINFIFHGDQLVTNENGKENLILIDELLDNNPNLYYGVDELYGGVWLLKPEVSKEEFISHFTNYKPLIEKDLETWNDFIERHQDQVLWGTDRGWSSDWSLDEDTAIVLNDYSRFFIAHLSPDVQEKIAYKNAEKLIR